MLTTVAVVLLLSLRTISLAADVTVYKFSDYDDAEQQKLEPFAVSQFPWKFGYFKTKILSKMFLFITNKPSSVTAINFTYTTDDRTFELEKLTQQTGRRKGQEYYYIGSAGLLQFTEIKFQINLYTTHILCSSLLIAKGRAVANITNEPTKKEFPDYGTHFHYGCVLVVDLMNKCDENAQQESSQNIVLIYVIPSVIGMCVITSILVIYISVRKYCHRKSIPVETIELNTCSTANEVVYADLSFVHGDSQPPRGDEESPYVEIIGVLKPGNVNNK